MFLGFLEPLWQFIIIIIIFPFLKISNFPGFYTLLEENDKTSIEHQRRLNPVMKEVVGKEVLKWLNAGFIYAISNNP